MNRDGLYTVQAVSRADGTKHNIVIAIEWYSSHFMDWWRFVKPGELTPLPYRVHWDDEYAFENNQLLRVGRFMVVCQSGTPTEIHLHLNGEEYKDINYSLKAFEKFFIFRRYRPDGFGVCVTVKV